MSKYEKVDFIFNSMIHRVDDDGFEVWIPIEPANSDYQAYLASLQAPTAQ